MQTLDEFIRFAENSRIVVADYESREARLYAMVQMAVDGEECPLLRKWIADVHRRLDATHTLYTYAKAAQKLPLEDMVAIYKQLCTLKDS